MYAGRARLLTYVLLYKSKLHTLSVMYFMKHITSKSGYLCVLCDTLPNHTRITKKLQFKKGE